MKRKLILGSFLAFATGINAQSTFPTGGSNAGIGTTSPQDRLHIMSSYNGSLNGGVIIEQSSNTGGNASLKLINSGTGGRRYDLCSTGQANGQAGNFSIYDYTAGADRLFISGTTGCTGIGTITPLGKLHVVNNANPLGASQYGIKSDITQISSVGAGGYLPFIGVEGSAITNYAGESLMYGVRGLANNGQENYGGYFQSIGGSSALNSYGIYATASGGSINSWAGYFAGNINCTGAYQGSDRKLKRDIRPLENSLAQIMKLKPATYSYRTDEFKSMQLPNGKQLGLIAQELEEVFPELVKQVGENTMVNEKGIKVVLNPEYKSVNYVGLIPVILGGVQDLNKIIEAQQKTIELQHQKIEALENKMSGSTGLNNINIETGFQMSQNEPNPFTHETVVKYTLPQSVSNAFMAVYDLTGKQITTFPIEQKGASFITITSEKLSAGIYIYSIVADGKVMDSKRMIVADK